MNEKTVTVKQKYVEDRIREAARTLHRLPEERVQGYFSAWPAIKRDEMEILQMEKQPMRIRPTPMTSPKWKKCCCMAALVGCG